MRTRSIEEVRETLARIYARPVLTPTHGARVLDATMNYCAMSDLRLYYRAYGADVRLEFPETGYLLQLVPLRGKRRAHHRQDDDIDGAGHERGRFPPT